MDPLLTAGILLLLTRKGENARWLIAAGALVTGGILVKQQGAFSALAVLGWLVFELATSPGRGLRSLGYLIVGAAVAVAPVLLYFLFSGELLTFLTMVNPEGAITYASGSGVTSSTVWRIARQETMRVLSGMPLLFYAGTALLFYLLVRSTRRRSAERTVWLLLVWVLGACLGVVSGMRFYTHYYIQLIPPLSVAVGWLVYQLQLRENRHGYRLAVGGLLAATLLWSSFGQFVHDVRLAWWQAKAAVSSIEAPAVAEQRMAEQIRSVTQADDGLLVWGHAEGMYFLAQRLAPTRYYKYWAFMRPPAIRWLKSIAPVSSKRS
jgi:4-amino-4-deoxy-L-arabinose transferase-like glycosyltransferase